MSDDLIDVSALPEVVPGEARVRDGAGALQDASQVVRSAAHDARSAWAGIDAVLHAPGATEALPRAMDVAWSSADLLASTGTAVAAALETFADELTTVRRHRRALLADVEELLARVARSRAGAGVSAGVPDEYRAVNDELHVRADRLHVRWQQAQDDLAATIRAQIGGGAVFLPGLVGGTTAPPLVMVDLDGAARGFEDALRLPVLQELAARGPHALEQWAAEHPEQVRRLLDHPPATETVRRWWDGLCPEERTALVTGLSTVVGNLAGVRYADRGRANRHTLEVELPRARAARQSFLDRFAAGRPLLRSEFAEYARVLERARALEALDRTLSTSTASAPRSIVALTLGDPPLAAVAVGDLDSASTVTVTVPGMGSTVADSTAAWTEGAANLRAAQRSAAAVVGADRDVATVAWIGYDTPDPPPSTEVLGSARAEQGAEHLSRFLRGVSGTRGWSGGSHLSVVAHSYGTTTATLAVARTPVDDLTLLASAGIDPRVPDAHAVAVPDGHVWASQAAEDFVADVGRGFVEVPASGLGASGLGALGPRDAGNPLTSDRVTIAVLPSTHRLDPGDPRWGARTFSSEDEVIDGVPHRGVDGHAATPAAEAALRGERAEDAGYLDRGTSSLRNTAYTSLGYAPNGRKIP